MQKQVSEQKKHRQPAPALSPFDSLETIFTVSLSVF